MQIFILWFILINISSFVKRQKWDYKYYRSHQSSNTVIEKGALNQVKQGISMCQRRGLWLATYTAQPHMLLFNVILGTGDALQTQMLCKPSHAHVAALKVTVHFQAAPIRRRTKGVNQSQRADVRNCKLQQTANYAQRKWNKNIGRESVHRESFEMETIRLRHSFLTSYENVFCLRIWMRFVKCAAPLDQSLHQCLHKASKQIIIDNHAPKWRRTRKHACPEQHRQRSDSPL